MAERLFVITGASRGIGKGITHALAQSKAFTNGTVHFILTSTKLSDLEAAQSSLEDVFSKQHGNTTHLKVYLQPIDFSNVETVEENVTSLFNLAKPQNKWTQVTLIMNHGSLGGLELVSNISSNLLQLQTAVNVNITSCILFASVAMKTFNGHCDRMDLVNVSSLAAIKAFASWGVYCIGKAARDMLIQVVAAEAQLVSNGSVIKALNYAPGPVDTDMQQEIRTTSTIPEQRKIYTTLFETGNLVTTSATSAKLVSVLEQNCYENGAHVDFYDAPSPSSSCVLQDS